MPEKQWYALLVIDSIFRSGHRATLILSYNRRMGWTDVSPSDELNRFILGTAAHLGDHPFDIVDDGIKYWKADMPRGFLGFDDADREDVPPDLAKDLLAMARVLALLGSRELKL